MEKSLLERIGQAEENATRMTRAQSAALERSRADTQEEGGSGNQIQEQNQGQDQQKESNTGEIGNSQQIKSINEEGQGAEVAGQQNSEDQQRRAEGDRNQEAQDGVDGIPFIQITNADESEDESWHPPTRSQKGKNRKLLSPVSEEEELSIACSGSMAEGDGLIAMQAEINFLYATGKINKGAALLAKVIEMSAGNESKASGSNQRLPSLRRQTNEEERFQGLEERQQHVVERRQHVEERRQPDLNLAGARVEDVIRQHPQPQAQNRQQSRSPAPYRLIRENLSENGTEVVNAPVIQNRQTREISMIALGGPVQQRVEGGMSEAERAKAMLESGKGWMELENGDVIENGRLILNSKTNQLGKLLTTLSPVLASYMKSFKAYIPLTVFNKAWLISDHNAWTGKEMPSEAKILKGNVKMYNAEPPTEELTIQYEQWLDCMTLFIRYVEDAGWKTQTVRFKKHQEIVSELRENIGWMVALRYCRKVRQGVMRMTLGKEICNISELQTTVLEEVKQTCENFGERAYLTNPYAPGGPREHVDPETGLPRDKKKSTSNSNITTAKVESLEPFKKKKEWLPKAQYKAQKAAERQTNRYWREDRRDDRERGYDYNQGHRGYDYSQNHRSGGNEYYGGDRKRHRSRSGERDNKPFKGGKPGKGRYQ